MISEKHLLVAILATSASGVFVRELCLKNQISNLF